MVKLSYATTEPEPLERGSPLYQLPNVFLTPHIAGSLGNEAERLVAPLEKGRITQLRVGGTATMKAWQALLAGRTREGPVR